MTEPWSVTDQQLLLGAQIRDICEKFRDGIILDSKDIQSASVLVYELNRQIQFADNAYLNSALGTTTISEDGREYPDMESGE